MRERARKEQETDRDNDQERQGEKTEEWQDLVVLVGSKTCMHNA